MSKNTCAWVNGPRVPEYALLTMRELIAVWHRERNTPIGMMAADEICRRMESELTGQNEDATNERRIEEWRKW